MAQNFVSCEAFWNRYPAQPYSSGDWSFEWDSTVDAADNPIVSETNIPFPVVSYPGFGYVSEVLGYIQTTTTARATIQAIAGIAGWFINGAYTDNGGVPAIQAVTDIGLGRQVGTYRLTFDGDAQTAILALAGDPDSLHVVVRTIPERKFRGFFNGLSLFGEFVQSPPASIPVNQNASYINAPQFVDSMISKLSNSSGRRYNLAPVGATPVYANECSFAAIDVTGWVTIETGDIGVGAGQIPASVADNTAERFRYHPNTFFRTPEAVKGVAVRRGDTVALTATQQNSQPIGIYVNDTTIVDSRWLLGIDGEYQIVNLHLAAGSPKTPLQIWNEVFAPILQGSESTFNSVEFNSSLKLNRLSFLHYARCLDRFGDDTTQTNTQQLG